MQGSTATFQNKIRNAIVSDVSVGAYLGANANMNEITARMYNIGTYGYDFDGAIENTIIGGRDHVGREHHLLPCPELRSFNRVLGTACEPGGTSSLYNIASGCARTMFVGVADNVPPSGPTRPRTRRSC